MDQAGPMVRITGRKMATRGWLRMTDVRRTCANGPGNSERNPSSFFFVPVCLFVQLFSFEPRRRWERRRTPQARRGTRRFADCWPRRCPPETGGAVKNFLHSGSCSVDGSVFADDDKPRGVALGSAGAFDTDVYGGGDKFAGYARNELQSTAGCRRIYSACIFVPRA